MRLASQNYGKQHVRVLKVLRPASSDPGSRHEVKELDVGVRLEGAFELSYSAADNSNVVTTETSERLWARMEVGGRPHDHAFSGQAARPLVEVVADRGRDPVLTSGIADLLVMKSTGSGFAGFPRDEYTTLPEVSDRILSTEIEGRW